MKAFYFLLTGISRRFTFLKIAFLSNFLFKFNSIQNHSLKPNTLLNIAMEVAGKMPSGADARRFTSIPISGALRVSNLLANFFARFEHRTSFFQRQNLFSLCNL